MLNTAWKSISEWLSGQPSIASLLFLEEQKVSEATGRAARASQEQQGLGASAEGAALFTQAVALEIRDAHTSVL